MNFGCLLTLLSMHAQAWVIEPASRSDLDLLAKKITINGSKDTMPMFSFFELAATLVQIQTHYDASLEYPLQLHTLEPNQVMNSRLEETRRMLDEMYFEAAPRLLEHMLEFELTLPVETTHQLEEAPAQLVEEVEGDSWVFQDAFNSQVRFQGLFRSHLPSQSAERQLQDVPFTSESSWVSAEADGALPSLFWLGESIQQKGSIPLLSETVFSDVSHRLHMGQDLEHGVLYGELRMGWEWDIDAFQPGSLLLMDTFGQALLPDDVSKDRRFVMLNVPVGARSIYLTHRLSGSKIRVQVPVERGVATYLPLCDLRVRSFSGHVEEVDHLAFRPAGEALEGLRISVDQVGPETLTNHRGFFLLEGVWSVADYPVILEVSEPGASTAYQYFVSTTSQPTLLKGLRLRVLSQKLFDAWFTDVQADRFVIGDMSQWIKAIVDNALFPRASLLNAKAALPHIQLMDTDSRLREAVLLSQEEPYFLVGYSGSDACWLDIVDQEHSQELRLWSQFLPTKPGSILMLGGVNAL